MEAVEPLHMPPMVLEQGKTPAFLLAWRREPVKGWEGRLAVPHSQVDVRGEHVHGLMYRWSPPEHFTKLPGVDYGAVPRPAPDEDDAPPLRMPPMVLYKGDHPAFLLAWMPVTSGERRAWEAYLAIPPGRTDPAKVAYARVGAGTVRSLPEVDYSSVPRTPLPS
ncbi:hypothetical protein ACIBG8_04320 [Nonomuraea sp. NPDC050556]|uniref:hypothetical protein n=1 Tax=Nonomuraea sp. NPDC050556 TaxID=3364369 RepID=UPI003792FF38